MYVGQSNVDALADHTTIDFLVHTYANGALGHVEHNTRSAVVILEGHTLVDGGIDLDINVISSL